MRENRWRSISLITIALFTALLFGSLFTVPVLADDGPPPPVEETGTPSTEETEPPALPTEEIESPSLGMGDFAAPAEDSTSPAESSNQLPANTEVVVVNEVGEVLPLASQEAADIMINGDPVWCPVGVKPNATNTANGVCSPSFNRFGYVGDSESLLNWLAANPKSVAGVIWVAFDYDPLNETTLDILIQGGAGSDFASMSNFALTIQGGWNGLLNGLGTVPVGSISTLESTLHITNWTGAVTINNLVIQNTDHAIGTWDAALEVGTKGNIVLNNVTVQNNNNSYDNAGDAWDRDGIWLHNIQTGAVGTITINNVRAINNDGIGLDVYSNGLITLNNVIASGNGYGGHGSSLDLNGCPTSNNCYGEGVYLDNTTSLGTPGIVLKGMQQYFNNTGNGLTIKTKGAVTGANLNAMGNGLYGVYIDNCNYTIIDFETADIDCQITSGLGITLTGSSTFNNNGADGLRIFSGGVITISNITAIGNGLNPSRPHDIDPYSGYLLYGGSGKGVFLDTSGALTAKTITVSGTNLFNQNASTGLFINSRGAITLSNITADYNGSADCNDAFEWAFMCNGLFVSGSSDFKLSGYGSFRHNTYDGLAVGTLGAITAANLYAEANGATGGNISTWTVGKGVTLTGNNYFLNNSGTGLRIDSFGAIVLSNVNASYNLGRGADLTNDAVLGQRVTLIGNNNFLGNSGIGLNIDSKGAITLSNVNASNNQDEGARLYNDVPKTITTPPGVTLTGNNSFNNNLYIGLEVYTRGVITTYNLTASDNDMDGVVFENCIGSNYCEGASSNINMYGINTFNNNGLNYGYGALIQSSGSITINNVTANSNKEGGVYLSTCRILTNGKVITINNVTANHNGGDGIYIIASGPVTVKNASASNNTGFGLSADNMTYTQGPYNISVLGYGTFNNNTQMGLRISGHGNILTYNITANNNTMAGAYLINKSAGNTIAAVNVTMMGNNTFNGNQSTLFSGLLVRTDGAITLNNINANYNNSYGVRLDNASDAYAGTSFNITLNGINNFNYNGQDGLYFTATGNVLMTRVTAGFNDGLANSYTGSGINGVAGGNITLTCGLTIGNSEGSGYSLTAGTGKLVTLMGVISYGNLLTDVALPTPVIVNYICP